MRRQRAKRLEKKPVRERGSWPWKRRALASLQGPNNVWNERLG